MASEDDTQLDEIDVSGTVEAYRKAYEAGDSKLAQKLREQWKEWQGEDKLHETAFGEP
ncbi:MAG: hypothetical protein JWN70_542 [Planctomycetaceae bacterium]|nr:hypothetical protein [Planctomycetaceae bacterium]